MITVLLALYLLVALIFFLIPFFIVDFLRLTLLNKLSMILIMLFFASLWPVIVGFLLIANADQLTKKNIELAKTKIKELLGK